MHSLFSGDLDAGLGAAADLGADVVADADACSADGGRADGEAWGAVGGGEEVEAVHLPQGGRCLCHSIKVSLFIHPSKLAIFFFFVKVNTCIILVVNQVPGPTLGRTIWRIHKGEDSPDRGDQAAVRVAQGGGGVDQVPQGVHRQQRHDHLILIR